MHSQYNMRSPAVKRLMKEAQELRDPTELYHAQPLEDNLFEWHFTLRGPEESDFEGGVYHGRIILPPDYPMKPPSIILLTPNGRFETFKKICLSISGHHPESWQPSWSIRTALLAIIGFMPTHGGGAIGSLDYTTEERKVLAKKSQDWKCPDCGDVSMKLKPVTEASEKASQEAKELASQINFLGEKVGGSPAKINETDTPNIETSTSMATQPSSTSGITISTSSSASTAAQASSPYQWTIPLGWGTQFQQTNVPAQTTYPRFPYPPPFMAPPPGMVQPPGRNTQGIPFFPPLPFFPPMLRGFPPFPAQPKNVEGIQGGTSPQSGSMCTTVASPLPQKHQSVPSSSTSSPSQAVGSESAAATAAVSTTTLTAPMPDTETVGGASSAVSGSTAATSSVTITDAVASTHTATTEASVSSNNPATDLRQRRTTQPQEQVTRAANTITGPAPQLSESNGFGTIVMIVVLSLAITVLLFRRVLIQYFAKDYQGLYD